MRSRPGLGGNRRDELDPSLAKPGLVDPGKASASSWRASDRPQTRSAWSSPQQWGGERRVHRPLSLRDGGPVGDSPEAAASVVQSSPCVEPPGTSWTTCCECGNPADQSRRSSVVARCIAPRADQRSSERCAGGELVERRDREPDCRCRDRGGQRRRCGTIRELRRGNPPDGRHLHRLERRGPHQLGRRLDLGERTLHIARTGAGGAGERADSNRESSRPARATRTRPHAYTIRYARPQSFRRSEARRVSRGPRRRLPQVSATTPGAALLAAASAGRARSSASLIGQRSRADRSTSRHASRRN